MSKRELRTGKAELRSDSGIYFGKPVVYGAQSQPIMGMFIETFRSGAFDKCLDGTPDIYACVNHDPAKVLGRTRSKTLRIARAADGLEIEGDMPNTTYANDLREQLRRQDISGMSFIFEAVKDEWREVVNRENKENPRTIYREVIEARLYEVSFVTTPAYPATSAGLRSMDELRRIVDTINTPIGRPKLSAWKRRLRIYDRP